jgi:centrosomal protein CEP120
LDKEAEFNRYKEREHLRPEVKLQSEINMLNIERVELERKLDSMAKAKNHYKEQWTRALQEIAIMKKREEANAKTLLKKQQQELEHLRMRYLAAEENELIKTDHKNFENMRSELDRIKINSQKKSNRTDNELGSASSNESIEYLSSIDSNLQDHINRLKEERDTLLRTGVYLNTDAIIVELDKRIRDCLKEAKLQHSQN